MRLVLAAMLLLAGCAPAEAEPAARRFDVPAGIQTVLGMVQYFIAGFSRQPSDAALQEAVTAFWAKAGSKVTATTRIACYPWDGAYSGNGRPVVCRYSAVFEGGEESRATYESGFDNADADRWYLSTRFGAGLGCFNCAGERLRNVQ